MKTRNLIIFLMIFGSLAVFSENNFSKNCADNSITPEESKMGWKLLWDGKTTEGWRGARLSTFPKSGWVIENGRLRIAPGIESAGANVAGGGDIVTTRKYKNFELSVDFKICVGGNTSIQYLVDTELNKDGASIGCKYQIIDDEENPDAKMGMAGNRTMGSLYDLIPAPSDKIFRLTEFNTARIVVNGNKVEHYLNGKKILEYMRGNAWWKALLENSMYKKYPNFGEAAEGHILLQDDGSEVSFKNIKIREL